MIFKYLIFLSVSSFFVTSQQIGNSFKYGFQRCHVTCGDVDEVLHPAGNRVNVVQGKAGPKGEPGSSCDLGESVKEDYENIRRNTNLLKKQMEFFQTKLKQNNKARILICGSGVQNKKYVKDHQLQAASYWHNSNNPIYRPIYGRLFQVSNGGAWVAAQKAEASNYDASERWIQVEYDEEKTITAVVTQGRSTHDEYLRSFNVLYKKSGSKKLKFVLDEHGNPKVFPGNSDRNTPVVNDFNQPITAQVFRINALSFRGRITVRFDFLEC